jgi:anti-sigma B factor antagonist
MNVTKTLENGILTVLLDGKMDTGTTPQVAEEIEADIDNADKIVLDMKELKYISSAGLRLLLSLHKKMSAKGGMVVKNVNETNMEIFDFTGFADILNIE